MPSKQNINARDTYIEPGYQICLACPRYRCEPDAKDCPLKAYHRTLGRYWWIDARQNHKERTCGDERVAVI